MADEYNELGRDPQNWAAGDDPMTESQRVYLDNLANLTGEPTPDEQLTKSEAARKIDELRREAGIKPDDDEGDIEIGDDDRSHAV